MTDPFFNEGDEILVARPDTKEASPIWATLTKWGLVATAVIAPFAIIVAAKGSSGDSTTASAAQPLARDAAANVLNAWITGQADPYGHLPPPGDPLTGAISTGWIDYTSSTGPDSITTETNRFGVLINNVAFEASVEVAVSPSGAIWSLSWPSLIPQASGAGSADLLWTWPNSLAVQAGPAVDSAVQLWADAYFSGDPTKLRAVTSDPSPDHAYLPLSGFTVGKANVTAAAQMTTSGPIFARVEIAVTTASGAAIQMHFDILLTRANTATPLIVAWGPPGDGPRLKQYGNALVTEGTGSAATVTTSGFVVPTTVAAATTVAPTVLATEAPTTAAPVTEAPTTAAPAIVVPVDTAPPADPNATIAGAGIGG